MPELPEVETVKNGLMPIMQGVTIASVQQNRPNLRFPFPEDFTARLTNVKINTLSRRAKYLLVHLSHKETLVIHLGMSGRFFIYFQDSKQKISDNPGGFIHKAGTQSIHDHVIFQLNNGAVIRYNDARRFGFMDLIKEDELPEHKYFKDLGVEPLSEDLNPDYLSQAAWNKTTSLKAFLLDQRVIAGLGNIYVCEALFRTGLSPKREANILATRTGKANKKNKALIHSIKSVLQEAIAAGGSTLRDHRQADGTLGYFQHSFAVYGREEEPCLAKGCKDVIRRFTQNGRSTFYCPSCQK